MWLLDVGHHAQRNGVSKVFSLDDQGDAPSGPSINFEKTILSWPLSIEGQLGVGKKDPQEIGGLHPKEPEVEKSLANGEQKTREGFSRPFRYGGKAWRRPGDLLVFLSCTT